MPTVEMPPGNHLHQHQPQLQMQQQQPQQQLMFNPVAPAPPVMPPRPPILAPQPQPQQQQPVAPQAPPPGTRFPVVAPPPPRPSAEARNEVRPKRAFLPSNTPDDDEEKEEWESGWPAAAKRKRGWPNPNPLSRPESPAVPKGLGSGGLGPRAPIRTEAPQDRPASRGPLSSLQSRRSEPLSTAAPVAVKEDGRKADGRKTVPSADLPAGRRKEPTTDTGAPCSCTILTFPYVASSIASCNFALQAQLSIQQCSHLDQK